MLFQEFIKLHVWLILIRFWCLTFWLGPTNVTLFNVSDITIVSYLQGFFLICVCVWPAGSYLRIFTYANKFYASVQ